MFTTTVTNYFAGKTHGDTVVYSDEGAFQGGHHKVSKICVFHDRKYVYGLHFDYVNHVNGQAYSIIGTKAMGLEAGLHQLVEEVMKLDADEYLTIVKGRNGDIMDHISFHTSKGRSMSAGGSGGSDAWELKAPNGWHFNTLTCGVGGHVHHVKFHVGEVPQLQQFNQFNQFNQQQQFNQFNNQQQQINQFSNQQQQIKMEILKAGRTHNDTKAFNDEKVLAQFHNQQKVHKVHVWADKKLVFGVQFEYYCPGFGGQFVVVEGGKYVGFESSSHMVKETLVLDAGEYLVEAHGACGEIMDSLGFTTSYGKSFTVGGSGGDKWKLAAPTGMHICALGAGTGGHLHNIALTAVPNPSQFQQQQQQFNQFNQFNQQQQQQQQQKKIVEEILKVGKTYNDTQSFSDTILLGNCNNLQKVSKIHVFTDGKLIFGCQFEYVFPGFGGQLTKIEGGKYVGNQINQFALMETFVLENNEFLVEAHGRAGDLMDHLGFKTSLGRSFGVGGNGGQDWRLSAPTGMHIAVLGAGLGGHLHNLALIALPIPFQQQQQQQFQQMEKQFIDLTIQQNNQFNQFNQFQQQQIQQTIVSAGQLHNKSTAFSDAGSLSALGGKHKIAAISIFTDKKVIHGIQVDYSAPGFGGQLMVVNGQQHICHKLGHNIIKEVFVLDPKEYVTCVFGRAGEAIDAIGFKTSFGKAFEIGGHGGKQFEYFAPSGYHFHTVSGAVGEHHLDMITFEAFNIPQ